MQTVNLSRIHHIIKNFSDENCRILEKIPQIKFQYNFVIYENTTEADFEQFQEQLSQRKDKFYQLQKKFSENLAYIGYLKDILSTANQKAGIDELLNKNSGLTRKIQFLRNFLLPLEADSNPDLNLIKDVNFYKTTFTEQSKFYNLPVQTFTYTEIEQLQDQLTVLILEQQKTNDDIAAKNQATRIKIKKYETFITEMESEP